DRPGGPDRVPQAPGPAALPDAVLPPVEQQDLRAGAGVVCGVPLQPLDVVEAAPHAPVDLHEPDAALRRGAVGDRVLLALELLPAALLERGGGHQRPEGARVARLEI